MINNIFSLKKKTKRLQPKLMNQISIFNAAADVGLYSYAIAKCPSQYFVE